MMLYVAQTQPKTALDYQRLPEGAPLQLIDGEFIMSPSPRFHHQEISARLLTALRNYVEPKQLGKAVAAPADVYLMENDVYQPDILFVARNRLDLIKDDGVHGAPDFVIEILSPATAYYDEHRKKDIYQQSGVRELWIIDPFTASVEAFANSADGWQPTFTGKDGSICSSVLAEFCLDVASIFRD